MPRKPKPWFRKARDAWFVTTRGTRHNLGPDKREAFLRFYELIKELEQPEPVSGEAFVVLADNLLEWTSIHRAAPTHECYHVQQWLDACAELSQTSRRNCIRSIKRCFEWAKKQGYIATNPVEGIEVPGAERRELLITPSDCR